MEGEEVYDPEEVELEVGRGVEVLREELQEPARARGERVATTVREPRTAAGTGSAAPARAAGFRTAARTRTPALSPRTRSGGSSSVALVRPMTQSVMRKDACGWRFGKEGEREREEEVR